MRNTRRATSGHLADDIASGTKRGVALLFAESSAGSEPPDIKALLNRSQVCAASRPPLSGSRPTFTKILQSERQSNMVRLKDRGFVGNRIAKLVAGRSRTLCYRVKNAAISALLVHGAASLLSLEPSSGGPVVGLAFVGGGRLHAKPAWLEVQARRALQIQFAAALQGGGAFFGEVRSAGL